MKTIFTVIQILSREKILQDGQVVIRYQMRSRAMWHVAVGANNKVRKVYVFDMDFVKRHLLGNTYIVVIENPRFYI